MGYTFEFDENTGTVSSSHVKFTAIRPILNPSLHVLNKENPDLIFSLTTSQKEERVIFWCSPQINPTDLTVAFRKLIQIYEGGLCPVRRTAMPEHNTPAPEVPVEAAEPTKSNASPTEIEAFLRDHFTEVAINNFLALKFAEHSRSQSESISLPQAEVINNTMPAMERAWRVRKPTKTTQPRRLSSRVECSPNYEFHFDPTTGLVSSPQIQFRAIIEKLKPALHLLRTSEEFPFPYQLKNSYNQIFFFCEDKSISNSDLIAAFEKLIETFNESQFHHSKKRVHPSSANTFFDRSGRDNSQIVQNTFSGNSETELLDIPLEMNIEVNFEYTVDETSPSNETTALEENNFKPEEAPSFEYSEHTMINTDFSPLFPAESKEFDIPLNSNTEGSTLEEWELDTYLYREYLESTSSLPKKNIDEESSLNDIQNEEELRLTKKRK